MFSPAKGASDSKEKGEKLDERKLFYLLCENLLPATEAKLVGHHG